MAGRKTIIAATLAAAASVTLAPVALADGGGWGSSSGSSGTATAKKAAGGATVRLAKSADGSILVNAKGFTLYMFTADAKNSDKCVHVTGCAAAWPPLTVTGKPTAGSGVKASLLGTITISGGKKQVTYDGHPLYTYVGDGAPASVGYIGASGFGGTWYGVAASGAAVK